MSKRRLRNILCLLRVKTQDVFLTSFIRYWCLKDVSKTSFWCLLYEFLWNTLTLFRDLYIQYTLWNNHFRLKRSVLWCILITKTNNITHRLKVPINVSKIYLLNSYKTLHYKSMVWGQHWWILNLTHTRIQKDNKEYIQNKSRCWFVVNSSL